MEISKDKVNIQRRNDRLHFDEFEASYDRKLKTANKARNNRQLFLEGLAWCHDGNNLNDAVTEKKENISFKRGYEEGLYQIGFRYGYDYIPYDNIPELFSRSERCIAGYHAGEEKKLLDDSKNATKSHR